MTCNAIYWQKARIKSKTSVAQTASQVAVYAKGLKAVKVICKFSEGTIFLFHQVDTPHTDSVANKYLLLQATLEFLFMQ
jgi:hypothetical protein